MGESARKREMKIPLKEPHYRFFLLDNWQNIMSDSSNLELNDFFLAFAFDRIRVRINLTGPSRR